MVRGVYQTLRQSVQAAVTIVSFGMRPGESISSRSIVESWKALTLWSNHGENAVDYKDFDIEFGYVKNELDCPVRAYPWSGGGHSWFHCELNVPPSPAEEEESRREYADPVRLEPGNDVPEVVYVGCPKKFLGFAMSEGLTTNWNGWITASEEYHR